VLPPVLTRTVVTYLNTFGLYTGVPNNYLINKGHASSEYANHIMLMP
jgi:hypothetical protein